MDRLINTVKAGVAVALAIGLAACSTTLGRPFNENYAKEIKSGETTKEQVLRALGKPVTRRVSDGAETWTYAYYSGPAVWTSWISSTTEDEYGIRSQSGRQARLVVQFKGDVVQSANYTQEIPQRN